MEMHEINGIQLIRRLREMNINVPAYIHTGHPELILNLDIEKYSISGVFEKPFLDYEKLKKILLSIPVLKICAKNTTGK